MGVIPPAILGWLMYQYGKKQGQKQYEMAKQEIRDYIKGEFLEDITAAVRNQINGLFGPVAKAGSAEARQAAVEYARTNPGAAGVLLQVAQRGAARWLGKQFGLPKDVADSISGAPMGGLPFPLMAKKQDQGLPITTEGPKI